MLANVLPVLRAAATVCIGVFVFSGNAVGDSATDVSAIKVSNSVIKSKNDTRDYEWLTLENGLQALLVSDETATKAAAALDVGVGAKSDPSDRQGLAHFLEHMLFLGTKKFPASGEYQEFISSHGGGHNAYTSYDHTNYFFDINASYLHEALQRFSQFFVEPLFTERYVEREMNAVESEYRSRLRDDSRRSLDVFQQVINPEHPFSKLSVGNLQTLNGGGAQAARAELLKFYELHYSADNMRLVVIGRESTAKLREWVEKLFSEVPRHATVIELPEPPLFAPGSLPEIVRIKPEKDLRNLSIAFPVPSTREHYKTKPLQYIGNIIGHEGEGSLLSFLKQKDWAEQLSAGLGFEDDNGATFTVSLSLTEAGLQHYDEVLKLLFQSIARVDAEGVQQWLFKEQQQLLETRFRFQEKSQAINYASRLANDMHYYPPADVLRADYLMVDYRPDLIEQYIDYLIPENALITLMADVGGFDKRSPWYDTPYAVEKITEPELASWRGVKLNPAITVPEPNPFVPEKFPLPTVKNPQSKPEELAQGERVRLWWMQDNKFKVPKSQAYFNFHSAQANDSVHSMAVSYLYADLLQDSLNEFAYPAMLAGLQLQVQKHLRGVSIKVGGYSDKQSLLLKRIATAMEMDDIDPQRFAALKKERVRSWKNAKKQLPYVQILDAVPETLIKNYWSEDELVAAIEKVNIDAVQQFKQAFLQSAKIDAMVYGNRSESDAKRLAKLMRRVLEKPTDKELPLVEVEVVRLQSPRPLQRKLGIEHNDAALLLYQQGKDRSDKTRALLALTAQLLKTDFFQQLRTEQQLGYVVFADVMPVVNVPGVAFVVQSPTASGAKIYAAIEEFFNVYAKKADTMTDEYFTQQKSALISDLREQPKNVRGQAGRYWEAIAAEDEAFDQRSRLVHILDGTSLRAWRDFFRDNVATAGVGQFVIWSAGDEKTDSLPGDIKSVQSLHEFKRAQTYYEFPTTLNSEYPMKPSKK